MNLWISADVSYLEKNKVLILMLSFVPDVRTWFSSNDTDALKPRRASFLAPFLASFLLSTLSYPPFSLALGPRADSSQTRLPCLGLGELCV